MPTTSSRKCAPAGARVTQGLNMTYLAVFVLGWLLGRFVRIKTRGLWRAVRESANKPLPKHWKPTG